MEDAAKNDLLEQFRRYLDGIDDAPLAAPETGSEADLFTVSVEMAALRNEVRTEARLMKDALDQFRAVFQALQSSQSALEQELQRARERERAQERTLVQPLLLDMLDLRDRLAAGLQPSPEPWARWYERWRGKRAPRPEPWQEGLRMTLRRLDQMLLERRVSAVELLGQRLDPRLGRVVATRDEAGVEAGIVLEVVRAGFLWGEALLRPAEVIVSKPDAEEQA